MALIGVFEHPKTIDLASRMKLPINHVVGILEHMWHWTARYAPTGELTRYAAALPLQIAPEAGVKQKILLREMAAAGFLDTDPEKNTIAVHGWSKRADRYVHRRLQRAGLTFADGTEPRYGWNKGNSEEDGQPAGQPAGQPDGKPDGKPDGRRKNTRREPLRARGTEPVPEPVSRACASVGSIGWGEEFLEALKKTGKFPRVTKDTIVLACRGAEDAVAACWQEIVAGAVALPDERVGAPLAWLQAQVRRVQFRTKNQKMSAPAVAVYRPLAEREGNEEGGTMKVETEGKKTGRDKSGIDAANHTGHILRSNNCAPGCSGS